MRVLNIGLLVVTALAMSGCLSGWVLEESPTGEDLLDVFGVPGGKVFAVGKSGTVIVREGTNWRKLDSGVEVDLYGVWGTAGDHVVVVGDDCTALEYNGAVEPDEEGEYPPDLRVLSVEGCPDFRAISGYQANTALAVGDGRVYWYNGQGITQGGSHGEHLLGISANQANNYYLSGDSGRYKQYDGDSWQTQDITMCPMALVDGECPIEDPMRPILWDVWAGENGVGATVGTFGGLWMIPPPQEGPWEPLNTQLDGELRSVFGYDKGDGAELFAVGHYGAVLKTRGGKVSRASIGTNNHLNGVWVSPSGGDVYVVGDGGVIAHLLR